MRAFVYSGDGVSQMCLNQTLDWLKDQGPSVGIDQVDVVDSENVNLLTGNQLFVMPGGRDLPYLEQLGTSGAQSITSFVRGGGRYLGICAGAYFAANRIIFQTGSSQEEIVGERPLKFFQGTAMGTLYSNKFEYGSESGAHSSLVGITGQSEGFYSYYNGGCTFLPDTQREESENIEIVGRYMDVEGCPPAVVCLKVGKGRVVLSGIHPEVSPAGCQREGTHPDVVAKILSTDNRRKHFLKMILLRLTQED